MSRSIIVACNMETMQVYSTGGISLQCFVKQTAWGMTLHFTCTRQFTRATHCSLSRTKIILLFHREAITKLFCIVGCYTHYKLIGYVPTDSLTTFSSRVGINSRCRRSDRSCRRSCCRRSDGPLAINRDHSMLSPLSSLPFRLVGGDEP